MKPSRCADNSGHRGGFFIFGLVGGGSLGKRVENSPGRSRLASEAMAGRTDIGHFASGRVREASEVFEVPYKETAEVHEILRSYGLNEADTARVAKSIKADKKRWVDFMMQFEWGLEAPNPKRAGRSALTSSLAYITGGLIPLGPYFFFG